MEMTTFEERSDVDAFARRAASHFLEFKDHRSYTDGEIEQGCFFALRFGLDDDCVLVFKIDEHMEPINYQNAIKGD